MRHINRILIAFSLMAVFFACKDDAKDPYPATPFGPMAIMTVETPVFDVTDLANSSYEALLETPSSNVSSYSIAVARSTGGVMSDTFDVKVINSFPADMAISATEVATALGITINDFLPGDRLEFYCTVTDGGGNEFKFEDMGPDLAGNPGQKQAFAYTSYISCPYTVGDFPGTYDVLEDEFWGTTGATVTVVDGPGAGEITIENFMQFGQDVVVVVNESTGIATFERQNAFISGTYGQGTVAGLGFAFGCTGAINLTHEPQVAIGGWGPGWVYNIQKQ